MKPRYTIVGMKEFETDYRMNFEEVRRQTSVYNEEQAVKKAREYYECGGYSSIYIEYTHTDSSCYYNPATGHEPVGKDWITHFENE